MLSCGNYRKQILPLHGLFFLIVGYSCLFSDFSTVFSQRLYSLACVSAEVSFPLSQQLASDLTEISFSALCQKKKNGKMKRKNNSPGLCRLPLCWVTPYTLIHAAYSCTLSLYFELKGSAFEPSLLALRLKISKKLKFMVLGIFLSMRPALGMHVAF